MTSKHEVEYHIHLIPPYTDLTAVTLGHYHQYDLVVGGVTGVGSGETKFHRHPVSGGVREGQTGGPIPLEGKT